MLFDETEEKKSSVVTRYYQDQMDEVARENIFKKKHRGTLCVAPMGSGKSLTMALTAMNAAKQHGRGVLILAHLKGLVRNNASAVERLGWRCYLHYGDEKNVNWRDVKNGASVSASIQSLSARALSRMPVDAFCCILIDEGHHAVLDSHYAKVVKHFGVPVVLYSATPDRADGEPLVSDHALCQSVAFNGQVRRFIQEGWILRPLVRYDVATKLDFSIISNDNREVTEKECERIWQAHKSDYAVIKPLIEKHEGMQTVSFAPTVKMAKLWAELVNDELHDKARYIASYKPCDYTSAKMPFESEERKFIERQFEAGDIRFLFNKGVFLEGADLVAAQLCMLGVYMKSRSMYAQCVGRVLRPCNVWDGERAVSILSGLERASNAARLEAIRKSKKPYSVVLDYGGSSGVSKLSHPASLFCYNHGVSEEVEKIARAMIDEQAKKGRDVDIEQAIQDAEESHKRFVVADREARRAIAVICETVTREIDPFDGKDVTGLQRYKPRAVNPPSPKIVESIRKLTKELGKNYSDQFYRELTSSKSFAVMKQLRAQVDVQRSKQPCPKWLSDKLQAAGIYDHQPSYKAGLIALKGVQK